MPSAKLRIVDKKGNRVRSRLSFDPACKAYRAWGMKKNYGKEYEGVIRSTFIISPEGKIAESWSKVKVRVKRKDGEVRHVDVVKDRLKDLQCK